MFVKGKSVKKEENLNFQPTPSAFSGKIFDLRRVEFREVPIRCFEGATEFYYYGDFFYFYFVL
jgi:hypothetical protein